MGELPPGGRRARYPRGLGRIPHKRALGVGYTVRCSPPHSALPELLTFYLTLEGVTTTSLHIHYNVVYVGIHYTHTLPNLNEIDYNI